MIIYPSKNFADSAVTEIKCLTIIQDWASVELDHKEISLFDREGVSVYVEAIENSQERKYAVLPLVEFVCYEIISSDDELPNIEALIKHWRNYVQTVKTHLFIVPDICKLQPVNLDDCIEFKTLCKCLASLILNSDLYELDSMIRVNCGYENSHYCTELDAMYIATNMAQCFKENKKNNHRINKLESLVNESDLTKLQVVQLQEELEQQYNDNLSLQSSICNLENSLSDAEQRISQDSKIVVELEKKRDEAELQIVKLNEELELSIEAGDVRDFNSSEELALARLQIAQLQEEIEYYYQKYTKLSNELKNLKTSEIVRVSLKEVEKDDVLLISAANDKTLSLLQQLLTC